MMKRDVFRVGFAAGAISIIMSFGVLAGWTRDSNGWWYKFSDGTYPSGGIYTIDGEKYAFNDDGYMKADTWVETEDGGWMYATSSGAMAANQWVGDYYMGADGKMQTDTWVGEYYVGGDGKWVRGAAKDNSYASYYSSGDEYGDLHNPFRDAPLGYGYDNSSYSGSLGRSELETADIRHYN